MRKKITLGLASIFMCATTMMAQTMLFNFESGTTQAGTYAMNWGGAPYITSYGTGTNPDATTINSTATTLNLVEVPGVQWGNNYSVFTLTTPTTITAANRYLHIMYRTNNIAGGGYSIHLNINDMNGVNGSTRFDGNLTANNVWQDIVIDLNYFITNNIQLSKFIMNPDLNNWAWGGGTGGTYNFDEIILSNSPLPRGTAFLTGNNLYDFEPATAANISGVNTSSNANNPVVYPFSNPFVTSNNLTSNVGKRSVVASPQWWTGFSFSFVNPVLIDADHKYLHIMVTVPVDGQKIALDVKQGATNILADSVKIISTANVWQDVVFDLSSMVYMSGISLKMGNWDVTAIGDYYFDQIWIDGSATPRVSVSTAIAELNSSMRIFNAGKNIHFDNACATPTRVTIYNGAGQKVSTSIVNTGKSIITVENSGLYFVNCENKTVKLIVK